MPEHHKIEEVVQFEERAKRKDKKCSGRGREVERRKIKKKMLYMHWLLAYSPEGAVKVA